MRIETDKTGNRKFIIERNEDGSTFCLYAGLAEAIRKNHKDKVEIIEDTLCSPGLYSRAGYDKWDIENLSENQLILKAIKQFYRENGGGSNDLADTVDDLEQFSNSLPEGVNLADLCKNYSCNGKYLKGRNVLKSIRNYISRTSRV